MSAIWGYIIGFGISAILFIINWILGLPNNSGWVLAGMITGSITVIHQLLVYIIVYVIFNKKA